MCGNAIYVCTYVPVCTDAAASRIWVSSSGRRERLQRGAQVRWSGRKCHVIVLLRNNAGLSERELRDNAIASLHSLFFAYAASGARHGRFHAIGTALYICTASRRPNWGVFASFCMVLLSSISASTNLFPTSD